MLLKWYAKLFKHKKCTVSAYDQQFDKTYPEKHIEGEEQVFYTAADLRSVLRFPLTSPSCRSHILDTATKHKKCEEIQPKRQGTQHGQGLRKDVMQELMN